MVSENTIVDRGQGQRTSMYPDKEGNLTLEPHDALRGLGDLTVLKSDGSPEFCDLGRPPVADGRMAGIGDSPDNITLQNTSPVPLNRASLTLSGPLIRGATLPDASTPGLAKIPKSLQPTIKKIPATSSGYQAYTAQNPGWFFYTLVDLSTGVETLPSPPSLPFFGGTGQSYRAPLPQNVPAGYGIGLYFPEPSTSRPEAPGRMWRQRVVDPRQHYLPYYDLTGPFRHERLAPTSNETALSTLPAPQVRRVGGLKLVLHHYRFAVTQVDRDGKESVVGVLSPEINIGQNTSGSHFEVVRPALSPTAVGWYCYALIWDDPSFGESLGSVVTLPSHYYRAYFRNSRVGADVPIPSSQTSMIVVGDTTEGYSKFPYDLAQADPPHQDSTGVDAPSSPPEAPIPIGAARPAPGPYYAVQVDMVGDSPALPSDPVPFNLGSDEIPRIVFSSPANDIANGTYLEVGSDGLPLDHQVDQSGGVARMEAGRLVLETNGPQSGAAPSSITDSVITDPLKEGAIEAQLSVEDPKSGTFSGTVELVLRQLTAANVATDTVLTSANAVGDIEYYAPVDPTGTVGSPLSWRSDTDNIQLLVHTIGGTKNNRIRIKHKRKKSHRHRSLRIPPPTTPPPTPPPPGQPPPTPPPVPEPGSEIIIAPPPEPPQSPETYTVPTPRRPLSSGVVLEHDDYESGAVPSGWAQNTSGGAAISVSPVAALTGSFGLRLLKSTGGSLATANLSKSFPATHPFIPGGRHDSGLYSKLRIASLVGAGSVRLRQLCRPSDGVAFAWIEVSQQVEIARLTIMTQAFQAGNVALNIGGVLTTIPVNSTAEVSTLTINQAPTAPGTVRINLDDGSGTLRPHDIIVGGTAEVRTLTFSSSPSATGNMAINIGGTTQYVPAYAQAGFYTQVGRRGNRRYIYTPGYVDTPEALAQRVASTPFPGWSASVSGRQVTFVAQLPGPRAASSFSPGNTGVGATMALVVPGAADTASALADRIASSVFPGWIVSRGTGTSVIFTANRGGPRVDATYDPRSTGATGTMSVTTPGLIDDPAALATRIRTTAFSGWTLTGSGNQVTFTANAAGPKQNASYDPQGTGANAQMVTLQQGTNMDVIAFVQDDSGTIRSHKIFAALTNSTIFNIDLTVSGAGTQKAVVAVWGSQGSAPLALVGEFEQVSLKNYPAGMVRLGVASESSASLTWDIHIDEVNVTDRGLTYYRHHNAKGEWLPVLGYYGVPGQPPLQKVPIKDGHIPVLPGITYDLCAFVFYENIPSSLPARPLYVTAHAADGSVTPMGDITGPNGLTGSAGWQEYTFTVTAPDNCYALRVNSRDVSVGTILIQEIAAPLGGSPRRSYGYATSGEYIATLFIGTPNKLAGAGWGRELEELGALIDFPPSVSGTATALYASAPTQYGPWGAYDPAPPNQVMPNEWWHAKVTMSGDGISSGVLRAGSPYARYALLSGLEPNVQTLLRPDGSEFPGGAMFTYLPDWSAKPVTGRTALPSGQPYDYPDLFEPVGSIAAGAVLVVFSREAKRYLEKNWKQVFGIDAWDETLSVKLSAPPAFERTSGSTRQGGDRIAAYEAQLGYMWVLDTKPFPVS